MKYKITCPECNTKFDVTEEMNKWKRKILEVMKFMDKVTELEGGTIRMNQNQETQDKQGTLVELGDKVKGQIELPSLDISPYIGQKVKIEKVEEHEGNFGYYIRIITEPVATIKRDGNEDIVLRATRMFGLHQDEDKNIGWGEKTQLGVYLKKVGKEHYRNLIGMEVTCQSQTSSKDNKDYLTFN